LKKLVNTTSGYTETYVYTYDASHNITSKVDGKAKQYILMMRRTG